ncbi:histidine phosphatase family protein [Novosphingobium sp. PC22D]|uniref:histidine phosphatase family protein n=1 Tax=Novosphingobium sp. PC22D TaxID=1962403 RepID=UPI000BEFEC80|nr:histidine phosphatase family protein [Novosphingobium sp. PC22D]PEQ13670.1 histidine phosphatase family protein [Novosphingobium sp. PC22D]
MRARLLHLLRHGAPETPGLMLGHTDAAPTPAGIARCVDRIDGLAFDALVSSDLVRCARAAQAIAAHRNLAATIDSRWRELDLGAWDGLHPSQIDPAARAAFWSDPDANPPPDGERWSHLTDRVADAIAALPARDTLVVTHGGAIRAALHVLLGFDQPALWAFDLPYGVAMTLRLWPGPPRAAQIVGLRP